MGARNFQIKNGLVVDGDIAAVNLDISGNVDVDGTLEADAITLNGTSLATSATTDTTNASNIGSGTLATGRLAAALTAQTSMLNTSLVVGRDADNQIKFSTDNQMIFRVGAGDGVTFKASGEIEATSLDISGDVDVDGTLEADAITVNGSALASSATTDTTNASNISSGTLASGRLPDLAVSDFAASAIVTESEGIGSNDDDNTLPTSAAVKDYVDNNAGGGASALGDLSDAVTTATENVGVGENALDAISSGSGNHNTAIGFDSLTDVSTGDYNVGVGLDAGKSVTTGSQNTFLGSLAGGNIGSSAAGNVIIGYQSGYSAQSSSNSIAIGYDTGKHGLKSASNNIAIGYQAMLGSFANSTGANNNIGIGYHSMHDITTGDDNITIGYQAGELITTGSDNIAIGYEALDAATTEDDNIAIGYQAMSGAISGAEYNVVIGNFAGDAITSADNSVIIGYNAGTAVTTGAENVMIGYQSGYGITDGDSNIFIGQSTGFSGGSNEQGNVGIGHLAMSSIANADYNVGVGYRAGRYVKGQHNVYVGYDSGNDSSNTGSKNIGVGYQAGNNITSGSNNVVIGAADVSSATGDSQLSISSGDGGVTWITGTSAGHVSLGNFTFDADQTVGSGQDNYVLTYDNSAGTIGLEAASGGGVSLANDANNRVVTATGSGGINGEANLTFNGSTLALTGDLNVGSGDLFVDDSAAKVGIGTTSPDAKLHVSSGTDLDCGIIIEADTDNNDEDDLPFLWFKQDGDITVHAIQATSNRLQIINNISASGGIDFALGTTNNTGTTNPSTGTTTALSIESDGGVQARKTVIKTVSTNTTLADEDSGKTIYWTGGTLTLPATAQSGQQFVVINNKGSSATPGLGTSNAIQTGWTAHAAMDDETARTYISVAANKWIYIG